MTILISKANRDNLGIDSIERGLVWSAFSLIISLNNSSNTNNSYLTNVLWSFDTTNIYLSAKIPFNEVSSLSNTADIISNIIAFNNNNVAYSKITPNTLNLLETIPIEPDYVISLEQYFVWCSYLLATSTYPITEYSTISISQQTTYKAINISLTLRWNYRVYLVTNNAIQAINKLVNHYIISTQEINQSGSIIPSTRYWLDPVNTLSSLKALPIDNILDGSLIVCLETFSSYIFVSVLPGNPDNITYVLSNNQTNTTKGWIRTVSPSSNSGASSVAWVDIANKPSFSNVAISGNYNHLINKPIIPVIPSTWLWSNITNKPTFSTVAISGNYNDLINKPTVDNSGIVDWSNIQNKPTIPTKISDLTNDLQFITISEYANGIGGLTLPWANITNHPTIPTKTSDLINDSGFINISAVPVTSVNGQTGNVIINVNSSNNTGTSSSYSTPRIIIEDYCSSSDLVSGCFVASGYQAPTFNNTGKYRQFVDTGGETNLTYLITNNIQNIGTLLIRIGLLKLGTDGEFMQIRLPNYAVNDAITGNLFRVVFNNTNGGGLYNPDGVIQTFWTNESRGYYDIEYILTYNPWLNNYSFACNIYQHDRLMFAPNIQTTNGSYDNPLTFSITGLGSGFRIYYVKIQNTNKNI